MIINKVSLLHLVIVSKISFKAKCYLLYSMLLDILVGSSDVAMSSLVTCNYHSLCICQVTDARVLQTVELVTVIPF